MTLGKYLFLMTMATLLCWGALALVVFFVDPEQSGTVGILIFYLAAFFAIIGTASIFGFLVRYFFKPRDFAFVQVKNSFRQAIWFAILVVIVLFLQSKGLIAWWNLILLVLALAVLEMFWMSLSKQ